MALGTTIAVFLKPKMPEIEARLVGMSQAPIQTEIHWIQHEISASFRVEISQFSADYFDLPWRGVFQNNQILETPIYRATSIFLCW
jgi:hypothetical protein